jgi:rod shape-determining protein MreC
LFYFIREVMDVRSFGDKFSKFARTKFFIIAASVAVFLTVFPLVLSLMGRADIVKSAVNFIATPFKSAAVFCGEAVDGFFDYFTEFNRLKEENAALREELDKAHSKNDAADAAIAENEWLRKFILFSREHPEYNLIDARTVGRDSGDFVTSFTLNKGSSSGIEAGQSVITPEGLVGYVSEVGSTYAKVKCIISTGTSVGAMCERSGAYGTLEGAYGREDGGLCKMTFASKDADVAVGDVIVTSGVGSIYPYGLSLGRITSVTIDQYSRELIAYVEPMVDFSDMSRVMVIGREADKNE